MLVLIALEQVPPLLVHQLRICQACGPSRIDAFGLRDPAMLILPWSLRARTAPTLHRSLRGDCSARIRSQVHAAKVCGLGAACMPSAAVMVHPTMLGPPGAHTTLALCSQCRPC
jgi:hypothetical protein